MEFDDYKIDPNSFEQMAKAYYSTLAYNDFRFVKIKTNVDEKQKILDQINEKFSSLYLHIEFLQTTSKAKTHAKNMAIINQKISLCKNSCNFGCANTLPQKRNNLCNTLKNIIETSAEIVALCNFLSDFSQTEIDDKICGASTHLLDIIQNTAELFGECHYRY